MTRLSIISIILAAVLTISILYTNTLKNDSQLIIEQMNLLVKADSLSDPEIAKAVAVTEEHIEGMYKSLSSFVSDHRIAELVSCFSKLKYFHQSGNIDALCDQADSLRTLVRSLADSEQVTIQTIF